MNASNPRAYRRAALLTLLLAAVLAVVTCAVGLTRVQVPQNRFTTGTVAIDLNGGKPILTEDEYLFEPGMTVNKDFTLSNTGTADVYYKLYFRDVSGELADVLEVTLTDGSDVLYTGTLAGLTRSTAATAPAVLAVGQARTLQASFHCPENTGNTAQQARMSFVLCADAVQTKNNPTGLFD
ncbi:hypothetical protein [Gemmiger sp.]|uniref:hypothetical protein n=1 Tax=Gemmiger sp. TaxID=2049027 RepID=UPI003A93297C